MSIKEGRLQQAHHLHQHDSQNGGKGIRQTTATTRHSFQMSWPPSTRRVPNWTLLMRAPNRELRVRRGQNGGKGIRVRGESKANQRCDRNLLSCANCDYLVHRETQYVLQLLHKGLYVKGCFYGQKHGTLCKRLTELAYTR